MESGVFLPALDDFMLSPLVTWVSSVCRELQRLPSRARTRDSCLSLSHTHTLYVILR